MLKSDHRKRKNPSANEAWQKRKHEVNASRGLQVTIIERDADGKITSVDYARSNGDA